MLVVYTRQLLALHRSGGGCPLAVVRVASAADVGGQQIVTQQSAHSKLGTAMSSSISDRRLFILIIDHRFYK